MLLFLDPWLAREHDCALLAIYLSFQYPCVILVYQPAKEEFVEITIMGNQAATKQSDTGFSQRSKPLTS